ncbi:23S rRNA (pseudouridine(1915)-N(3))-methyltransferase RlmH [Arcobacter sp. CECT 8986]|uniref:23S rRNA (pseudouridine(1915)-N(3))-methyltransferase RlmH n=1 Tax=Arcobacter sp. CECT 8986 TaxID=2044507 RepID=UPI001009A8BE|nr:23S rRNA (pseudouridine(1915)-N(3))-methyltransferase RlmH [Arcobacter sp. CECT 8986]RXJ99104.1 23S rRNA (pseudouridine(1915)-N(3))-methyltransferase RlmH [Arcobacter sp. CECT 8986]
MKINIYAIMKASNDEFEKLTKEFIKMSSKYANVEAHYIFNKKISKAQTINEDDAKKSYSEVYEPFLKNSSLNIALDVLGKKVDSFKFANFFHENSEINFFIGGAYGFERQFLTKCDKIISLSELTMAHKVAHLVLMEQIFRGLCIKNNHPYHK